MRESSEQKARSEGEATDGVDIATQAAMNIFSIPSRYPKAAKIGAGEGRGSVYISLTKNGFTHTNLLGRTTS